MNLLTAGWSLQTVSNVSRHARRRLPLSKLISGILSHPNADDPRATKNGNMIAQSSHPQHKDRYEAHNAASGSLLDTMPWHGDAHAASTTCLRELHIKNFALVAEDTIQFRPGLNVITGESGSGKSVLVEALALISGSAASSECVRAPATCAIIEGHYSLDAYAAESARKMLAGCGLPTKALPGAGQAGNLIVRREIVQTLATSNSGGTSTRSRCFINGAPTSLRVLRDLGGLLVDANAQNAALALKDPSTQLMLLDRVAGTVGLAGNVRQSIQKARLLEGRLEELSDLEDEEERDRIQALCDSVRRLRVVPNEELRLRQSLKNMESRKASVEQCASIRAAVTGEPGSGGGGIVQALRSLEVQLSLIMKQEQQMAAGEEAARVSDRNSPRRGNSGDESEGEGGEGEEEEDDGEDDEDEGEREADAASSRGSTAVSSALEALSRAREQLGAAEVHVKAYSRSFQFDIAEHQRLSDRLKAIEKLVKAHGFRNTAQLLDAEKEGSDRLKAFYEAEDHQEEWEAQLDSIRQDLQRDVVELSRRRREAAGRMSSGVDSCLKELSMSRSHFDVGITWQEAKEELPVSRGVFIPNALARQVQAPSPSPDKRGVTGEAAATAISGDLQNKSAYKSDDMKSGQSGEHPGGEPGESGRWYRFERSDDASAGGGIDDVEFLLSAGPGEPLRPLTMVASGGESARVMLALKAAPSLTAAPSTNSIGSKIHTDDAAAFGPGGTSQQREDTLALSVAGTSPSSSSSMGAPVLILDELDSSIGARLGSVVGRILKRMCSSARPASGQIICVTHLPQVACYADQHIRVAKKVMDEDGRVTTTFQPLLSMQERTEEVAAMLGLEKEVALDMLRSALESESESPVTGP